MCLGEATSSSFSPPWPLLSYGGSSLSSGIAATVVKAAVAMGKATIVAVAVVAVDFFSFAFGFADYSIDC